MKNIILNLILLFSVVSIISCCTNQKSKNDKIIKRTTVNFLNSIKKNDSTLYKKIYKINDGGDLFELNYLHKHYSEINPNNILYRTIKIKDTFNIGAHMKYVLYKLKKPNYKPFETNKDLKLYLFFWKDVGYDKIFEVFIIGDMAEWEDAKPLEN